MQSSTATLRTATAAHVRTLEANDPALRVLAAEAVGKPLNCWVDGNPSKWDAAKGKHVLAFDPANDAGDAYALREWMRGQSFFVDIVDIKMKNNMFTKNRDFSGSKVCL